MVRRRNRCSGPLLAIRPVVAANVAGTDRQAASRRDRLKCACPRPSRAATRTRADRFPDEPRPNGGFVRWSARRFQRGSHVGRCPLGSRIVTDTRPPHQCRIETPDRSTGQRPRGWRHGVRRVQDQRRLVRLRRRRRKDPAPMANQVEIIFSICAQTGRIRRLGPPTSVRLLTGDQTHQPARLPPTAPSDSCRRPAFEIRLPVRAYGFLIHPGKCAVYRKTRLNSRCIRPAVIKGASGAQPWTIYAVRALSGHTCRFLTRCQPRNWHSDPPHWPQSGHDWSGGASGQSSTKPNGATGRVSCVSRLPCW